MLDKLDQEFAFGREALDVRAYRQELLSSNIANADTPGYKARDVDFASALAGALKKTGAPASTTASNTAPLRMAQPVSVSTGAAMAMTSAGHMAGTSTLTPAAAAPTTTATSPTGFRASRRSTAIRSIWTPSACSSPITRCISKPA